MIVIGFIAGYAFGYGTHYLATNDDRRAALVAWLRGKFKSKTRVF